MVEPLQVTYIDWDFIKSLEGWRTYVYIPEDKDGNVIGQSGATIGMGFDIGQHGVTDFNNLGLSADLAAKLGPYLGIKGAKAKNFLQAHPLSLSPDELQELTLKSQDAFEDKLCQEFEANSDLTYAFFNGAAKTVMASVAWQYGDLKWHCPAFWKYCTKAMCQSMVKELRNFGDKYTPRRLQEASYLEINLKKGTN